MAYRAAIAGCGLIGSEFSDTMTLPGVWSHADAYTRCAETELVAVCDQDAEKAQRCATRWNVPASHTDFAALLDDARPEIVSICTPDAAHYGQIRTALQHPAVRAVLAEKPLALDLREATELVSIAAERNIVLAVNYSRRYASGFEQIRAQLRSGILGTVQCVTGFYTKGTLHNGGHWFDLAEYLIGPTHTVSAVNRMHEEGTDPTLDVALDFACGATGHLQGLDSRAFALFEIDILCSKGRVRIVDSGFSIEVYKLESSPFGAGYNRLGFSEKLDGGLSLALLHAVENTAACLNTQRAPICSGKNAIQALNIGLAAHRSAVTGQVETLPVAPATQ